MTTYVWPGISGYALFQYASYILTAHFNLSSAQFFAISSSNHPLGHSQPGRHILLQG